MARELEEMIDMARKAAGEMGLYPYYLYRQKNIAGNFENVGYAKVDKAGIYNILIMEEKQSIVAAGQAHRLRWCFRMRFRRPEVKRADDESDKNRKCQRCGRIYFPYR